jgi:hypothetical protein
MHGSRPLYYECFPGGICVHLKLCCLILALTMMHLAGGVTWAGSVRSNGDRFDIIHTGTQMDAIMSGIVQGTGNASVYTNVAVTDVKNKIRLASKTGSYNESDFITVKTRDEDCVNMTIDKPAGSDLVTVDWTEKWPIIVTMGHETKYTGKGINYRNFVGNNRDYAGTNFLFNTKLTELTLLGTNVTNTNVTVITSPSGIASAQVLGNRFLNYNSQTTSNGLASLKYQTTGGDFAEDGQPVIRSFDDERYVGQFNVTRHLRIKINSIRLSPYDDWLNCSCQQIPNLLASDWQSPSCFGLNCSERVFEGE